MTLTHYPHDLPCPLLAGAKPQGGSTFLRSNFEYATRQRQTYCNDYIVQFNFVMKDKATMKRWKDFYYLDLANGVHSFLADWEIEGIDGEKQFRFADIYSPTPIGKGIYRVTAIFEMVTKIKNL